MSIENHAELLNALRTIAEMDGTKVSISLAKSCAMDALNHEALAGTVPRSELDRALAALKVANSSAERFEREWYLRGDALEAAQARIKELEARADIRSNRDYRNGFGAGWNAGVVGDEAMLKYVQEVRE